MKIIRDEPRIFHGRFASLFGTKKKKKISQPRVKWFKIINPFSNRTAEGLQREAEEEEEEDWDIDEGKTRVFPYSVSFFSVSRTRESTWGEHFIEIR